MTELSKNELRSILRQRRRSLSGDAQATAGQEVTRQVFSLPEWSGVRRIAIYHTADGEIGTGDIIQRCHGEGIEVYLPVLRPQRSMVFAQWAPDDELVHNSFGIFEPPPSASRCAAAKLDIVFLPLVGWDRSGGRLGMGAGYYDRALDGITGPLLVGLAHRGQEVDQIPQDSWDIALDVIVTDAEIYRCRQ